MADMDEIDTGDLPAGDQECDKSASQTTGPMSTTANPKHTAATATESTDLTRSQNPAQENNHCSASLTTCTTDNVEVNTDNNSALDCSQVSDDFGIGTSPTPCTLMMSSPSQVISDTQSGNIEIQDPSPVSLFSEINKDDSGILIEKSSCPESCSGDVSDRLYTDSGHLEAAGETDCRANFSGDLPDLEDSESAVSNNQATCDTEADSHKDNNSEDMRSMEEDEDDDDEEIVMRPRHIRVIQSRQEILRRRLASDSDDTDSNDNLEQDSSDLADVVDLSDEDDSVMYGDAPHLKDTWYPLKELAYRERGYGNSVSASNFFRIRTGGSINLVQRLNMFATLEHHDGCVNSLHFNEQGTLLASGSDDLQIAVWRWENKEPFFVFESGHRSNVFQSKFMPYTGDTHIVSCARDGQVRLAELSSTGTCKGTKKLAQHKGAAHKLALLQDSSHVFYSCGEDAVCYEVDLRQEKPNKLSVTKERNRKVPLYSIHSNPFKSFEYCVSGRDHFVRVYDKRMPGGDDGGPLKKFCPQELQTGDDTHNANVTCAVYNYNGEELLGSYNDDDIYLFDNTHSDGAGAIGRYKGHRNNATVKGINFYGPKSEFIVSGSDCGNIFFWEKKSQQVIQYFTGDKGGVVNVLEPHPHAPILATSGLDHDIKIWMPLKVDPTNLNGLKKTIKKNCRERNEERMDPGDPIDSSMFWRLMQHFRRTARRRARQEGDEVSSDSENSDEQNSGGEEDEDTDSADPIQCVQS